MKQFNFWDMVFLALFCVSVGYTQTDEEPLDGLSCDQKAALLERNFNQELSEALQQEMLAYIEPCIHQGNSTADYLYAQLVFMQETTTEQTDIAITILEKLAIEEDHVDARRTLGLYYKNAFDINTMDISKLYEYLETSLYWFEKAESKGDPFSEYAVGYYMLKGLGGTYPDYGDALRYFEDSDHPMAKHWEGVMHYFGYGEREDQEKGMELLLANDIVNSQTFATFLSENQRINYPLSSDYERAIYDYQDDISSLLADDLVADFFGVLVEYCWAGRDVTRTLPIDFSFAYGTSTSDLRYTIHFMDTTITGTARFDDNVLYLNDAILPIQNIYKDDPEKDDITYQITDITFDEVDTFNEPTYTVGVLRGVILEYIEPLPPTVVVLHKSSDISITPEELDYEIFPNPVSSYLDIRYHLEEPTRTYVEIYDQMGIRKLVTEITVEDDDVKHRFNVRDFLDGLYFVKIHIGDTVITSTVLKD